MACCLLYDVLFVVRCLWLVCVMCWLVHVDSRVLFVVCGLLVDV